MIVNLLFNEVNKKDVFTLMTATTKELFIHASMRDSRFYLTSKGLMDGGLKSETNFNLGEVPKLEQETAHFLINKSCEQSSSSKSETAHREGILILVGYMFFPISQFLLYCGN